MSSKKSKRLKQLLKNISNMNIEQLKTLLKSLNENEPELKLNNPRDCLSRLPVVQKDCLNYDVENVRQISNSCGIDYTTKKETCKKLVGLSKKLSKLESDNEECDSDIIREMKQPEIHNPDSDKTSYIINRLDNLVDMVQIVSSDVKKCFSQLEMEDKINNLLSKIEMYQVHQQENQTVINKLLEKLDHNDSKQSPDAEPEHKHPEPVPESPDVEPEHKHPEPVNESPDVEPEHKHPEPVNESREHKSLKNNDNPTYILNKIIEIVEKKQDNNKLQSALISFYTKIGEDTKGLMQILEKQSKNTDDAYNIIATQILNKLKLKKNCNRIISILQKNTELSYSQTAIDVIEELCKQHNEIRLPDNKEIREKIRKCLV